MDLAGPSAASNVRVAVRARPLSIRERQCGATECISVLPGVPQIVAGPDKSFTYDDVFGANAGQREIFDSLAEPLLRCFLSGYNCTILAYGQTGSGKTFTMGTGMDGNMCESTQGIVPRSIESLFECLSGQPTAVDSWEMFVSYLEIYNEDIVDLLAPVDAASAGKKQSLSIREDAGGEIFLTGIREEPVRSASDVFSLLQMGALCRTTKSTDMNLVSSRSHAIFTMVLKQTSDTQCLCSKLHFVDLAGSERLKRTNASGERAKESISINSGLLALGNVISALGDESKHATHIPYRDSKLTRLLQGSLGGNSRTLMIACVSVAGDNYSETLNTLRYANRARNIKNRAQINQDPNGAAAFEILQLKKQVSALKQELLQARSWAHARSAVPSTPSRLVRSDSSLVGPEDALKLQRANAELRKQLERTQQEKLAIEAERDALKSQHGPPDAAKTAVIHQHLRTIAELRLALAESKSESEGTGTRFGNKSKHPGDKSTHPGDKGKLHANAPPHSPGDFIQQSAGLVDRARQDIAEKLAAMQQVEKTALDDSGLPQQHPVGAEQLKAAVETRVQTLIRPLKEDLALKEELTHSLHTLQLEYMAMQQRYNDRVKFLHDALAVVQKERDSVLTASMVGNYTTNTNTNTGTSNPHQSMRMTRIKYEERIKRMGKEVNELKERLDQQAKESSSKWSASEALLRSLRQTIQTLKADKARLQGQLQEESLAVRSLHTQQASAGAVEMAELRMREQRATDAAKKWHRLYDSTRAQQQNLRAQQKRLGEQFGLARVKIRSLLQLVRRNRIKMDSALDTPGWRQVMQTPSAPSSAPRDAAVEPMDLVNSPTVSRIVSAAAASLANTPRSRLAYGWVPTEMAARQQVSPDRPRPLDFFAQIADAASLSLRASSNPFLDPGNKSK